MKLTAKTYLETLDIQTENTILMTVIEGHLREPNLLLLMEDYAKLKIAEYRESRIRIEQNEDDA